MAKRATIDGVVFDHGGRDQVSLERDIVLIETIGEGVRVLWVPERDKR